MIALVGASGFTGSLIARELARRKLPAVWIARSQERMDDLARAHGLTDVPRRVASPTDETALAQALSGATVVIDTVGPFVTYGEPVVRAAIAGNAHFLDTSGEQSYMRDMQARHHAAAQAANVAVLCGCAYEYAIGTCLGALAARELGEPGEIDVFYLARDARVSHGTAKSALRVAAEGGIRVQDGKPVADPMESITVPLPGFDNPSAASGGMRPRSVVSVPGGEALHLPSLLAALAPTAIRTWMGLPPGLSRWVWAKGALGALRFGPVRNLVDRTIDRTLTEPDDAARSEARFTVVARARVPGGAGRTVHLSVEGRDPYAITAVIAVEAAARLHAGPPNAVGVIGSAAAFDPAEFLAAIGLTIARS